ncbi:serine hydrolase [Clostridium sp.]|uniref:serine hydrolase domain-containing protein n=1 Tax=Clostridium sp. TaxID=1506 RepID=UPI0028403679|nr:serine hydrolase [Clostridium sp.]MDR3598354.1 serine hydrolase [Clostridium sp.]
MSIENIIDKDFSGAVLVKKGEDTIFKKAFGYADLTNCIPNEIYTKFATASGGKVFVAVAILKLIEEGKLTFDDFIGDILDIDLKAIDPKITVHQLLNHTSGIPDYFDESVMKEYDELWKDYPNYKIRTSSDIVPLFINKPMMYTRGEKFQYNNTGYVVLGLIIEKITGIPFDKYLDEVIFKPCNMLNTGYYELDRLPAKCANAYIYDEQRKEFYSNIYSVDVKGTGAGGAFTTVLDIENFWNNILNGKLISKEMAMKMLAPQVEEQCYGYGIWLKKNEKDKLIPYFQGCDPGVSFFTSFDMEKKHVLY